MMNGIVLRADSLRSEGLTEEFIESLQEMNGLWSRFSPWQKKEAQQLVEASGFSDLESVPLAHWSKCNGTSLGASVDAWCRFVDKGPRPARARRTSAVPPDARQRYWIMTDIQKCRPHHGTLSATPGHVSIRWLRALPDTRFGVRCGPDAVRSWTMREKTHGTCRNAKGFLRSGGGI